MTAEFTKQAEEMLKAAREARIPDNVKAMAEQGLNQSRKAYDTLHSATKQHAQQAQTMMDTVKAGSMTIAETILAHSAANAEAVFDAALKMVRAQSLPEAARVQAEFVQAQLQAASQQTQTLMQVSGKVATETMGHMQAVATKGFGKN